MTSALPTSKREYMKPFIKWLDRFLRWALITLSIFMVITVTWQVVSRYLLKTPSSLTEEIARFQLIWLGLLGAVYTFRNRMHVGIDILVAPLSGKKRLAAEFMSLAASFVFSALVLIYGGGQLVQLTYALNQTTAALGVKVAYIYSVIPLSGVLICIYAIYFMRGVVRHGKLHRPSELSGELDGEPSFELPHSAPAEPSTPPLTKAKD